MTAEFLRPMPVSGDQVAEMARQFNASLKDVPAQDVYPLPRLTSQINHEGKYSSPVLSRSGLYVTPEILGRFGGSLTQLGGLRFTPKPAQRVGREDSHNGVFFGVMHEGSELEVPVAVKRNDKRPSANLGEIAMHQLMADLGIPTLRPAGVLVEGEPMEQSYLLTHKEDSIITLDTIEWEKLDAEEKWLEAEKALDIAATLHPHALFHDDLDYRNVAFDQSGDLVVIDPELMVSAREIADRAVSEMAHGADERPAFQRIVQLLSAELRGITRSAKRYVLGSLPLHERPFGDKAVFKILRQRVYLPYRARMEDADTPYRRLLVQATSQVMSNQKLESQGKSVRASQ